MTKEIKVTDYPLPIKTPLTAGTDYFFAGMLGVEKKTWIGNETDNELLDAGYIHLTENNAAAHFSAMQKISGDYTRYTAW
ncbi:hypothetical protein [Morganella morganii]|uniref:hypothetical protein n=1 Tax=Morganella morganii TaxID=582 RepID=UPI0034D62DB0